MTIQKSTISDHNANTAAGAKIFKFISQLPFQVLIVGWNCLIFPHSLKEALCEQNKTESYSAKSHCDASVTFDRKKSGISLQIQALVTHYFCFRKGYCYKMNTLLKKVSQVQSKMLGLIYIVLVLDPKLIETVFVYHCNELKVFVCFTLRLVLQAEDQQSKVLLRT